jgi:hypothetical protein
MNMCKERVLWCSSVTSWAANNVFAKSSQYLCADIVLLAATFRLSRTPSSIRSSSNSLAASSWRLGLETEDVRRFKQSILWSRLSEKPEMKSQKWKAENDKLAVKSRKWWLPLFAGRRMSPAKSALLPSHNFATSLAVTGCCIIIAINFTDITVTVT